MQLSENNAVEFLKKVDLFSLLTDEEVVSLLPFMKEKSYAKDEQIFREGDDGETLYIIESGNVLISVTLPDKSCREIASFHSGDFFGEMSLFDSGKRSATCRAVIPSKTRILQGNNFLGFLQAHPVIAIKIMFKMLNATTHRLQAANSFFSGMIQWGELARKRAITDELTGVYNRRFLDDAIADQINKARENKSECVVVMVDLDHFGTLNKTYGLAVGDKVIIDVVSVFRSHLLDTDLICRYGGDEFTLIFPSTDLDGAYERAEKVRIAVSALETLKGFGSENDHLSLSMGIASYPRDAQNVEQLKKKADEALYIAKENGRNRVGRLQ